MGVGRGEVVRWRWGGGKDAPAARTRAVEAAMTPAEATGKWQAMPPRDRRMTGIRFLEAATPGEEAQAIALALRRALDTPEKTARSEEHTSELQSLMRISYAVFCLKKKKKR